MRRASDSRLPVRNASFGRDHGGPTSRDRSQRRAPEALPVPSAVGERCEAQGRDTATEVLCDASPSRLEQAGQGTAQWGRHRIAADGIEALRRVGMFGTIDRADLVERFASARRSRQALAGLADAGLLRVQRFRRGQRIVDAVSLTRTARQLLERMVDPREPGDPDAQVYRVSMARPSQILHDVAVYRAACREWRRIEAAGGRVTRILSDSDLQRLVDRRVARLREAGGRKHPSRSEAAAALGLQLADGRLVLPDVRIEYRQSGSGDGPGERGFVDVEVVTRDYREQSLAAKAASGFRIHAMDADGRLGADPSGTGAGWS